MRSPLSKAKGATALSLEVPAPARADDSHGVLRDLLLRTEPSFATEYEPLDVTIASVL